MTSNSTGSKTCARRAQIQVQDGGRFFADPAFLMPSSHFHFLVEPKIVLARPTATRMEIVMTNLKTCVVTAAILLAALAAPAGAADLKGAKDPALMKRFQGSEIIAYLARPYDKLMFVGDSWGGFHQTGRG
jgi:hypothetical protein